jgi:hypothetical protein
VVDCTSSPLKEAEGSGFPHSRLLGIRQFFDVQLVEVAFDVLKRINGFLKHSNFG